MHKIIIRKNKQGKLLSIYWFAILSIVAGTLVFMTASFYGKQKDVRYFEEDALTNKVSNCISEAGYLKENVLTENFKDNFLKKCNLNFTTEDFSDWREQGQYYVEVDFNKFNGDLPDGFGENISFISEGNPNLKTAFLIQKREVQKAKRDVKMIVLHYTAGPTAYSAIQQIDKVGSVHYVIDRDGTVFSYDNVEGQYKSAFKPEEQAAEHAGCIRWGSDARPYCHSNTELPDPEKYEEDRNCCWGGGIIHPISIGIELVNLGYECSSTSGVLCDFEGGGIETCKSFCEDKGNGVEINGKIWEKYPDKQIDSLVDIVSGIVSRYDIPIDREHIIGHEEIDIGRKFDPGPAFPWEDFLKKVKAKKDTYFPGIGRDLYALDESNNKYAIKILSIIGKEEKNA